MFDIGDYIIYGTNGVCKVESVGPIDMAGVPKDKIYYTLLPVYTNSSKICTPVENERVVMRAVISKEEAMGLVEDINNIQPLWIDDNKKREEVYKNTLKTCDPRELIRIIKFLYLRKMSRLAEGKKATTSDEKYFKLAEASLYGEFAIALNMEKSEVEPFINNYIDKSNA